MALNTHNARRDAADKALEQAFFKLEAGLDLAEIALFDLLEVANDALRKDYIQDGSLERGQ